MPSPVHVLIAEDETLVAMMLEGVLGQAGFRVTVTHNGQEALLADQGDPADILITDLRMPIMDGQDLIRMIRGRRPSLPIIVTTAYREYMPEGESKQLVIISKPYQYEVLLEKLATITSGILRAEAGHPAPELAE